MAKKSKKPVPKLKTPAPDAASKSKKMAILTLSATIKAPTQLEVQITDQNYALEVLLEDIDNQRVWFETPPDKAGWMKLLYSADGPTGDPFLIGKIKVYIDLSELDANFGDFSELAVETLGGRA